MNIFSNIPRFRLEEAIRSGSKHEKGNKTEEDLTSETGLSLTSGLPVRKNTAEYLLCQPRPPFEAGTADITDVLFMAFLQGEIPDNHEQQDEIAQVCINQGFPSSLAWLFEKTKTTEFIYRSHTNPNSLYTLAVALSYSGLSLNSVVINIPFVHYMDLESVASELNKNDSLRKIDCSDTTFDKIGLEIISEIKGLNGDILVTGGRLKSEPPANSSPALESELPAAALNPSHLNSLSQFQLKIQGGNATTAIENARKMDLKKFSRARLPDISEFPLKIQTVLKNFFQTAYSVPYFMLHTTFSVNMHSVFANGSLLSRARLQKLSSGFSIKGLEDPNDLRNNTHHMVFATMGTNPALLQPPSDYERAKKIGQACSSFIINVDLFIQHNRSYRKDIIVKSCDWGEPKNPGINIPNRSITIHRLEMDAVTGIINPDAMIRYQYKNEKSGFSKEYALPVYGDIVTGAIYRQLIPHLLVQHLSQLPPEEQRAVFQGIGDEENSVDANNGVMKGILDAFGMLEMSVPGSLPLRLDYVDSITHMRQVFDLQALRDAVGKGQADEVLAFMRNADNFPNMRIPDWIVQGIHDIAMKNWLTKREKGNSAQDADRFLAILDYIREEYQQVLATRYANYKIVHASLDLLKQSDELSVLSVTPSQVNRLISELSANQEKVEAYLTKHHDTAHQALKHLQEVFHTAQDVSEIGLQSTLKARMVGNVSFNPLVRDKNKIKSLLYLASAMPALIAKVFGAIDLEIFKAENKFTKLNIIGHISGIKNSRSQSYANRSFLSDLLFNIPARSLFVPGNGMPGNKANPLKPEEVVSAAHDYQWLFSALRDVLREENLLDIPPTSGEQLLHESYDPGKWREYKNRFLMLAKLSKGTASIKDGGENRYLQNASQVIQCLSALDPDYAHFNLDPRHLQAILAGNYGRAKPAFDELIETIAADPDADENHRTTAIQLFHRMKLLEFEFYKDQVVDGARLGIDDYARDVLASL